MYTANGQDLDDQVREGTRGMSLGERPYLDPNSLTRREWLEKNGISTAPSWKST